MTTTAWINPKIIIGNTATGDYYYDRPNIVINIWEEIKKGNHVLLAAPRRVGKSSVMKHMAENCDPSYKCIFENVQGVESADEFYRTTYRLITSCLNMRQKTVTWLQDFLKDHTIEEIGADGIKLGGRKVKFQDAINHLLPKLNKHEGKIILFIDELPEVLHRLNKNGKKDEAIDILKNIRKWRQKNHSPNFHLVLAGSIGIHHVVKTIEGRTTDTNDLGKIDFAALTYQEAKDYISWATNNGATVQYNEDLKTYLLNKIQHYLPYFINLMLDEINKNANKNYSAEITIQQIDDAFNIIIKSSDHFKDWKNRLFDYLDPTEAQFLNNVLIHIAHTDNISLQKIYDLAVKHNKTHDYMELIDGLDRDGYITESEDQYIFISPFLKTYWKRNNPVYES